jgi:hypothetical protein
MMETKLTKQSEAILSKLRQDVGHNPLSADELTKVRKGLAAYESLGVLSNAVIKAAGVIGAIAFIWSNFTSGQKP